jgi:hypothetical protein
VGAAINPLVLDGWAAVQSTFCNKAPVAQQMPPGSSDGGQCAGSLYKGDVLFNINGNPNNPANLGFSGLYGPVSGVQSRSTSGGNTEWFVSAFGTQQSGYQPQLGAQIFVLTGTINPGDRTLVSTNYTVLSGSNNCGPSIAKLPPSAREVTIPNLSYDGPSGNIALPPVKFTIGDLVPSIKFGLHVPINVFVNVGGVNLNFNVRVGLNGDTDFDFNTGDNGLADQIESGNNCDGNGSDIQPDSPIPEGGSDDKGDKNDVRDPIRYLFVSSTVQPNTPLTEVGLNNAPDLYVPRLATVSFLCPIGDDGIGAWSDPTSVRQARAIVACPLPTGALDWSLTPAPGVACTAIPIRAKLPVYVQV